MNIREKYLEALKTTDDWVIVSEWAKKVGELYSTNLRTGSNQPNPLNNKQYRLI